MLMFFRLATILMLTTSFAGTIEAQQLSFGRYFSDHMVLQQGKPTLVRGTALPDSDVDLFFADQKKTAKADSEGRWSASLDPLEANSTGADMKITSKGKDVTLKNVLVGDVILVARQSSIDVTLGRDEEGQAIAKAFASNPLFRSIRIETIPSSDPLADFQEAATLGWNFVDAKQALSMSATAAMLGRDLARGAEVPVGIVDLNLNDRFTISWLSLETILEPIPNSGPIENRVRTMSGKLEAFRTKQPYGKKKKMINESPLENPLYPAAGYNGTILPLEGLGLKGLILQLGNDYPYMYYEKAKAEGRMTDRELMNNIYVKTYDIRKEGFRMEPAMLSRIPREWRKVFGDRSLPMAMISPPSSALWPYAIHNQEMREIQRKIAKEDAHLSIILPGMEHIPFSGQPKEEKLLAERALKWSKRVLFQDTSAAATGPVFERLQAEGAKAILHFEKGTALGLKAAPGALDQFEVADVDGEYVRAKAVVVGETIQLSTDEIPRIFHVRYNWRENPDQGLVNGDELPALPFRTEEVSHRWLVRYHDNDLAIEYYTPASEWKNASVTLINGQLEKYGYPHFSGWLGPLGIKTGPFGPNMGVKEVKEGSPADGKLFVSDVIYSVNGSLLGEEEEMVMSAAITESEAKDGKLVLGVHRDGKNLDIELKLQVMGKYSATSPWDCPKTDRIVENLEKYVVKKGAPSGFLFTSQLFLLGAGSPEHQWMVRKSVLETKTEGINNWATGYSTIYLSEYYLSTGDKRVLPQIKQQCDVLAENQIKSSESKRDGGWYGRGSKKRGYPAMAHAGLSAMLGLALAKECGVDVDEDTFQRGLAYLERKGARYGQIIYGDAFRTAPALIDPEKMLAGELTTHNGKVAEAAVLYDILEDKEAAYTNSKISTHAWHSTYEGHGGNFWNNFWTPLGAAVHNQASFMYFMKNHRWYRECSRMFDGSLLQNVGKFEAGTGLALVVPRKRLRILGAPKSPFSPDAPDFLRDAVAAYHGQNYEEAEKLALALIAEDKTDKHTEPTARKLAEEARRMLDGIKSDLALMSSLIEEGRLYEAKSVYDSLLPVAAVGDPQLVKVKGLLDRGKARNDDRQLYELSLSNKAGGLDESQATSAADLKRIRQANATAEDTRTWVSLTTKEFIPGRKKGEGGSGIGQVSVDQASKWRFTVLESRDLAPENWASPGFDDSTWIDTVQPVSWHLNHTTLFRTNFEVKDLASYDLLKLKSWIFRQQDVAIYLNGTLIGRINNIERKTGIIEKEFKKIALTALREGDNVLAIATRQNWRWGMLGMRVYNGGFDFLLNARLAEGVVKRE